MQGGSKHQSGLDEMINMGFTQFTLSDSSAITQFKQELLQLCRLKTKSSIERIEDIHRYISVQQLNDFRLEAIASINRQSDLKNRLIEQVIPFASDLLGSDLAVQKSLNLVLLAPHDLTSQLPLHADTWTGHSPFEIAFLFPLGEVVPDQNMFILPRPDFAKFRALEKESLSLREITEQIKSSFSFLKLQPGEAFAFWHNAPHGNSENVSELTHWSLNLRFKNIFTPYGQKKLGEYFIPLKTSPFTDMVFEETSWKT